LLIHASAGALRGAFRLRQKNQFQQVYAAAIRPQDDESEAIDIHLLALLGHMPELVNDQPPYGIEFFVAEIDVKINR
jgi:hypothetical protein